MKLKLSFLIAACLASIGLQAELFFTPQMIATHLESYSEKEVQLIEKDLAVVRSICLDDTQNTSTRFYVATAGAPGARKTTILEKFIATHPEYAGGVYLDPDPRTLKFMAHTYDAVAKGKFFPQRMGAYFAYADLMYLYWSDDLFSQERLAAVWRDGKLEVHDREALQRFKDKYEADRQVLAAEGQIIPAFESFVSK